MYRQSLTIEFLPVANCALPAIIAAEPGCEPKKRDESVIDIKLVKIMGNTAELASMIKTRTSEILRPILSANFPHQIVPTRPPSPTKTDCVDPNSFGFPISRTK